jgi:20S proteasome subunit alpha 2
MVTTANVTGHCRGVRPFGVSLLISGYDEVNGPSLYQVDPSGSYWAWKASAIGKNMINAKTFLEKRLVASTIGVYNVSYVFILISVALHRYNDEIELEDAVHTAILTVSMQTHCGIKCVNHTDMLICPLCS